MIKPYWVSINLYSIILRRRPAVVGEGAYLHVYYANIRYVNTSIPNDSNNNNYHGTTRSSNEQEH